MNRRQFLGLAFGGVAAVAFGEAIFNKPAQPLPAAGAQPVSGMAAMAGMGHGHGPTGDMIHQLPSGKWASHLLPFREPKGSKAEVVAELVEARKLKLFL